MTPRYITAIETHKGIDYCASDTLEQARDVDKSFRGTIYEPIDPERDAARDDLYAACQEAGAAIGSHGPCNNNSCKDCSFARKKIRAALAREEARRKKQP